MDTSGAARLLGDIRDITRFASRAHFRSIGGSFGGSHFGAVFNHRLIAQLAHRPGATGTALTSGGGRVDPAALRQLPRARPHRVPRVAGVRDLPRLHLGDRVRSGRPLLAVFIREIPLRGRNDAEGRRGHRRAGRPGEHRPRRAGVAVSSDRVGT
jgi:hypothetical protein